MNMNITNEQRNAILRASRSDSAQIIEYLEKERESQKRFNSKILFFTIFSNFSAFVAAILGIIALVKQLY